MTGKTILILHILIIIAALSSVAYPAKEYYICRDTPPTWQKVSAEIYCAVCQTDDAASCQGITAGNAIPSTTGCTKGSTGTDKCKVTDTASPSTTTTTSTSPSATTTTSASPSATGSAAAGQSGLEEAGFVKETCKCKCNDKDIDAVGIYKPGFWEKTLTDEKTTAKGKCQEQCARTCGGFTNCTDQTETGCTTCCDTFCTSYYKGDPGTSTDPGKTPTDLCKTSCKSTCKFKGTINGITDIIYMIAGLLGALMIAIHGIRMVTSQDPHDRDAAKSSILHVIIALIIIAMAAALVNMFITMGGLDISSTGTGGGGSPAPGATTTTTTLAAALQTCRDCTGSSCTWEQCKTHAGSEGCTYYSGAPNPCIPCSEMPAPLIGDKCGSYSLTPINLCQEDPCKLVCEVKLPTLAGGISTCGKK